MLNYKEIKLLIKTSGQTLKQVAGHIGYEYSGFVKAVKKGSLNYEARVKLAEILGITLAELNGDDYPDPAPGSGHIEGTTAGLIERLAIYKKLTSAYERQIKELERRLEDLGDNKNT